MKAIWNGTVIAESKDTVVVEGNHYFPASAVVQAHLVGSDHTSVCHWKGTANYYSIKVGSDLNKDAAWYYADPKPEASQIKGRIAFWRGVQVVG
jgi:uncharacterized protein (DUF427 family)